MITSADKIVLNETIKNARMSIDSIQTILNRVSDEELTYELNCQTDKYKKIEEKARKRLKEAGTEIQENPVSKKVVAKSAIQAKTLVNNNTDYIANMVIQGSTRGITGLTKVIQENRNASKTVCEIANELVTFEENNIERLKTYL